MLDEQTAIVSHIDSTIKSLSHITSKIVEAIDQLAEYRTAPITVATTGKIDVRDVVIPDGD